MGEIYLGCSCNFDTPLIRAINCSLRVLKNSTSYTLQDKHIYTIGMAYLFIYLFSNKIKINTEFDDAQKISRLNASGFNGLVVVWKAWKERNTIWVFSLGNQGESAKNPPMLKLVFSLELKNSNFRSSGKLPSFHMDESFYSELWCGYLFSNFLNVYGS